MTCSCSRSRRICRSSQACRSSPSSATCGGRRTCVRSLGRLRCNKISLGLFYFPDFILLSASSKIATYFAGSVLNSLTQLEQHNFTVLPWYLTTCGSPIEPSFLPLTTHTARG